MSNHLITEVYKRRVGGLARTAVMLLLADKASDDGSGIWASKQRMADELGTTRQTVITTLQALTRDGLVWEVGRRRCQYGYTVEYAIDVKALRALPLVPCHVDQGENGTGPKNGTGTENGTVQPPQIRDRSPSVRKRQKASETLDVTDRDVTRDKSHLSPVTSAPCPEGQQGDTDRRQAALRDPSSSFTPPVKELYTNPPRTHLEPYPSDTSYPQGGPLRDPPPVVSINDHLTKHFRNLQPAAQLVRWEEAFQAIGRNAAALLPRERAAWTEWLLAVSEDAAGTPEMQHAERLLLELSDY